MSPRRSGKRFTALRSHEDGIALFPAASHNPAMIRARSRWLLALLYAVAGAFHLAMPRPFLAITPDRVPWPGTVIALTGAAEIAGAAALVQPWSRALRCAGGIGLALYALCVWPANVNHMLIDLARADWPAAQWQSLPLTYHIPRLMAQPLIIWAALWVAEVVDWPFRRA